MDFKVKINQALDELDKLAGEGSTDNLREAIAGETDGTKLFLKFQALRETIATLKGQNDDTSFTVSMPDGSKRTFKNLDAFFADAEFKQDLKNNIQQMSK